MLPTWLEVALVLGAVCESTSRDDVFHRAMMWLFFGGDLGDMEALDMQARCAYVEEAVEAMAPGSPFQAKDQGGILPPCVADKGERKAIARWLRDSPSHVLAETARGFEKVDALLLHA